MPVSVKDYLETMKTVGSSSKANVGQSSQSDLKIQQLLSQLIEAISYSQSIDFRKKTLNSVAKGPNPEQLTTKQVLELLENQKVLIDQLAKGQKLSEDQSKDLTKAIDRFYEVANSQEVNYKKYATALEKFAIETKLPSAVKERLVNDSRDAHMIGKEQKDKEGLLLPIVKKIRNLLEDSREDAKQFNKKLFVSLDQLKEGFLDGLEGLMSTENPTSFIGKFLNGIADMLNLAGMSFMLFKKQFEDGIFKWGQLTKQILNIGKALSMNILKPFGKLLDIGKAADKITEIAKPVSKIGKFFSGAGKGLAGAVKALAKIPILGSILSIWMATERWKNKDYLGAFIELGSGLSQFIPGFGIPISICLDLINVGRETGFFRNLASTAKESAGKAITMTKEALMSMPVVGPIIGMIESIKQWKSGSKKNAIMTAAKSFMSMIPGGSAITSALSYLFGISTDEIEKETSQTTNSKTKTSRDAISSLQDKTSGKAEQDRKGLKENINEGLSNVGSALKEGINTILDFFTKKKEEEERGFKGPFGDAPISWQNESGGYSPKGLTQSARNATTNFNKLIGGGLIVTSAFRDPSKMMSLWNSARPIPGSRNRINRYGNEMADPRRSNHAKGLAIDVPKGLYNKLGQSKFKSLAKQAGFSLVYPESTAVHLEVPKNGEVKEEEASVIASMSSSIEPLNENDTDIQQYGELTSLDDVLKAFKAFNDEVSAGLSDSSPSNGSIKQTDYLKTDAFDSKNDALASSNSGQLNSISNAQSMQPTNVQSAMPQQTQLMPSSSSQPGSVVTEINDTDLALLNSLLFQ